MTPASLTDFHVVAYTFTDKDDVAALTALDLLSMTKAGEILGLEPQDRANMLGNFLEEHDVCDGDDFTDDVAIISRHVKLRCQQNSVEFLVNATAIARENPLTLERLQQSLEVEGGFDRHDYYERGTLPDCPRDRPQGYDQVWPCVTTVTAAGWRETCYHNDDNQFFLFEKHDDKGQLRLQAETTPDGVIQGRYKSWYAHGVLQLDANKDIANRFVGTYVQNLADGQSHVIGTRNDKGQFVGRYLQNHLDGTPYLDLMIEDDETYAACTLYDHNGAMIVSLGKNTVDKGVNTSCQP